MTVRACSKSDASLADQPRAVEAARAADALGVVVDLVPALVVDHRAEAQATVEQVDAARNASSRFGATVAVEHGRVGDRDLDVERRDLRVVRDDPVVVLVVPARQPARPPAVERIALALLLRRADDVRHAAKAHELVVVRRIR